MCTDCADCIGCADCAGTVADISLLVLSVLSVALFVCIGEECLHILFLLRSNAQAVPRHGLKGLKRHHKRVPQSVPIHNRAHTRLLSPTGVFDRPDVPLTTFERGAGKAEKLCCITIQRLLAVENAREYVTNNRTLVMLMNLMTSTNDTSVVEQVTATLADCRA